MNSITLDFSIERFALHPAAQSAYSEADDAVLPTDFADYVDAKGDRFRDMFTRVCLYLAASARPFGPAADETVIVGTEYGNLEAMLRFQRQAMSDSKMLSAQQFPHATTSSASTFINIGHGIRGGNATLNAGALTPAMGLLLALLHLRSRAPARSHLFLGDTYCPEALEDIAHHTSETQVSPGVCYIALANGQQFGADISVTNASAFDSLKSLPVDARIYLDRGSRRLLGERRPPDDSVPSASSSDHNRAFVFADFVHGLFDMQPGRRAALLLSDGMRVATILVHRRDA